MLQSLWLGIKQCARLVSTMQLRHPPQHGQKGNLTRSQAGGRKAISRTFEIFDEMATKIQIEQNTQNCATLWENCNLQQNLQSGGTLPFFAKLAKRSFWGCIKLLSRGFSFRMIPLRLLDKSLMHPQIDLFASFTKNGKLAQDSQICGRFQLF